MQKRPLFLAAALTIATACGRTMTIGGPETDAFGTLNGARVELAESGGIAALATNRTASHDERSFLYVRRQICTSSCVAPMDSVTGTMTSAASDSLFTLIWAESPLSLRDDYGSTTNGADMITYTLRMTFQGATKTVRADDGTMPPAMRRIVDAVRGIVDASRP